MKNVNKTKSKKMLKMVVMFILFFIGTCCIAAIDNICKETTGYGGKLVFDVEKIGFFN